MNGPHDGIQENADVVSPVMESRQTYGYDPYPLRRRFK